MKKLLLATTLLSLFSCALKPAKVTISTIGAKDSTVYLSRPIENFPLGVTDTLLALQPVTVEVSIEEISTLNLRNDRQHTSLIIEPGKEYTVTFDYSAKPLVVVNDSAQMMLNKLFADHNFYKYEFVENFTVAPLDTVASVMVKNFEQLIAKDKAQFDGIDMSAAKRAFIEQHIELFWITSLTKVFKANYLNSELQGKAMYEGYAEMWANTCEKYPFTKQMTPSYMLSSFADIMMTQKISLDNDAFKPKTQQEYWQMKYDNFYKHIPNAQIRKSVLANSLYLECINNNTKEEWIIPHIEKFNLEYPGNPYISLFDRFITTIRDFQQRVKGDFSAEVKFVADGDSIKSFDKVIKTFKGKPVFVDFWFSTCSPCQEQFGYSAPLKKFLKENGIEMLYFSIDRNEKDWHNTIKYFNLEGTHIRANQELHQDIDTNFGVNLYPHFMIIDAKGQVVVNRAKEPSEGSELFNQIKEALK